jgi:hypothetical protein
MRCRRHPLTILVATIALAALASLAAPSPGALAHDGPDIAVRELVVPVVDGPDDDQQVRIDATLYVPATATESTLGGQIGPGAGEVVHQRGGVLGAQDLLQPGIQLVT